MIIRNNCAPNYLLYLQDEVTTEVEEKPKIERSPKKIAEKEIVSPENKNKKIIFLNGEQYLVEDSEKVESPQQPEENDFETFKKDRNLHTKYVKMLQE